MPFSEITDAKVSHFQVDIGLYFDLQPALNGSEERSVAKKPIMWYEMNSHLSPRDLKEFRNVNFAWMWEENDYVSVHLNGPVWNHFLLNNYLWETAEKYNLLRYSKRQIFEIVIYAFFSRPTEQLHSFISKQHSRLEGDLHVGLQMRFGGVWADSNRYNGDHGDVASCFVNEVLRICKASSCTGKCSVFMTSDQPKVATTVAEDLASHGINVVQSRGDVAHIDEDPNKMSAATHIKTFGDWYILSLMSKLVSSRSGYSETAGWFGNIPSTALAKADTCTFLDEGTDVPDTGDTFGEDF